MVDKQENLRELFRQHWLHCRHLESERAWFMSGYVVLLGGLTVFIVYTWGEGLELIYAFVLLVLTGVTFFWLFNTMRWIYSFESHRTRVNTLARILWLESGEMDATLDPTMNISSFTVLPEYSGKHNRLRGFVRSLNNLFRTRYLFLAFYQMMLLGLLLLSLLMLYIINNSSLYPSLAVKPSSLALNAFLWVSIIACIALITGIIVTFRWNRSLQKMVKIPNAVVEGCNGVWAQKQYIPALVKEAALGKINLWAVDKANNMRLKDEKTRKYWEFALSNGLTHYINSDKEEAYRSIPKGDYVFVLTPDRFHSEITRTWVNKLEAGGRIIIEKPLEACIKSADDLKENLEKKGRKEAVFGFDHYLARVYPFLNDNIHYLKNIEDITNIEFYLLEAGSIPAERKDALEEGVVLDLLCHCLAVTGAVVDFDITPSVDTLQSVDSLEIVPARHAKSLITRETFARIEFRVKVKDKDNDIGVVAYLGKCVGNEDYKMMKIYGTDNERIELDLNKDILSVFDKAGEGIAGPIALYSDHVKSFIGELLSREKDITLTLPGVISFDAAYEILNITKRAKEQVRGELPEYGCHTELETILGKIEKGE